MGDIALARSPRSAPARGRRSPSAAAPAALDHAAACGGGVSACQLLGHAPRSPRPSSTATTRSTVTLGTPPAWWNARPARRVDQPLVGHVLEQRLELDLVIARARTRARSRACPPAGRTLAMKSRICLRVEVRRGRLRGMIAALNAPSAGRSASLHCSRAALMRGVDHRLVALRLAGDAGAHAGQARRASSSGSARRNRRIPRRSRPWA